MRIVSAARLELILAAGLFSGCSPAYVFKAWRGHSRLLAACQPIERLLTDPQTPPELRKQLRLVQEIRTFAFTRMSVPRSRNYTEYADIARPAATYVVSGSGRTSFEPKLWWFPVVGRVPYKGFFERADAEREREALERAGLDTALGGVSAYSTLRWSQDPVLSTMIRLPPGELAELLLHELAHTAVFLKGQMDFNEALATFCGERGAREFLESRFGSGSMELEEYRRGLAAQARRAEAMEQLFAELSALYASPAPDSEKLERRGPIFDRYRARLALETLNNATILAYRRYRYALSDFDDAHERLGRDWPKTLALLRSLDPRSPQEDLRRWLGAASSRWSPAGPRRSPRRPSPPPPRAAP